MKLLTQWAAASGALVLVVLAVRHLCRNRLSARLRYALWAVVLVRLLVPVQIPFLPAPSHAAGRMDRQMVYAIPEQVDPGRPELTQPIIDRTIIGLPDGREYYSGGVVVDREATTRYFFMAPAGDLAVFLWCAGGGVMSLALARANLRFAMGLKRSRKALEVPGCPLPVYTAEGLPSPCLFGLLRPAVYLTLEAAALPEGQRRHILAHELTHYAHGDHIWAVLRCLALALHWYDPLVWLAVLVSKGDGELACDEGAVKRLGETERIPYGRTLVGLVARRSVRPRDLLSCSTAMTGGKKTIQQRITLLVKKPETQKTALFGAAALVALAAVFAFGGGTQTLSYSGFLYAAGSAQAIQYGPPPYSSQIYPDPITDQDLLEQARALLLQAEPYTAENPSDSVFQSASLFSSTLSITGGGAPLRFYLYPVKDSGTCILIYLNEVNPGAEPLAVLPSTAISQLQELARQQWKRSDTWAALTSEELSWFQDTFFNLMDGMNIHNQFLTCFYERPEDIDMFQLFYNGSGLPEEQPISRKEMQALTGSDDWQGVWGNRVTREEMEAVLRDNTGLSLDQTGQTGLEKFTYLPEYGAYYCLHGDTNTDPISITSGFQRGDILILYYSFGYGSENRVVTLRRTEDGFQFVSNQRAVEKPAVIRYRVQRAGYTAGILNLLTENQVFLTGNGQTGLTPEALKDVLQGQGREKVVPEMLIVGHQDSDARDSEAGKSDWRLDVWGGGSLMLTGLIIPEELTDSVLDLCRKAESQDRSMLLSMLQGLHVGDITSAPHRADREQLVRAVRAAANAPVARPEDSDNFARYHVWEVTLELSDGGSLTLSAGQGEDAVLIQWHAGQGSVELYCEGPELHRLIRQCWTEPEGSIVQSDLAPVKGLVDMILGRELEKWNHEFEQNGLDARYTGIQLTGFRLLSTYPDLLRDGTVRLYAMDYGLSIEDLGDAVWAGGNYADGNGLFHPYGMKLHLLESRRADGASCEIFLWEFPLEVGRAGFEGLVDADYILDVVMSNLRDMLDPPVPASVTDPRQAAEEYGKALAQYYRALGPGHPQAVTYAQLAGAEVYQQTEDALCANITLAVDPVKANTVYWQAGAGLEWPIDGPWAGHGLHILEYRLERQGDGSWRCTDRGTGGVGLPEFAWQVNRDFSPNPTDEAVRETDLRVTVTRLGYGNHGSALEITGRTGAVEYLLASSSRLSFCARDWGETVAALTVCGVEGEPPAAPTAAQRKETARWIRASKNGREVPGVLYWERDGSCINFHFDYSQLLPMEEGDTLVVEIGPVS